MNLIEFSAPEEYLKYNKDDHPIPATQNIPEWYKKITHTPNNITIKGCMPFLDSLTAGYILKLPQDIHVKHNIKDPQTGNRISYNRYAFANGDPKYLSAKNINLNFDSNDTHPPTQFEGSDLEKKNKKHNAQKILNPWMIKTPPGYSCLFIAPLNGRDDRFEIISGIVDTDTFTNYINFPYIYNDKYEELDVILKKGTPYVQVIPFKRDNWKMKVKKISSENTWKQVFYPLHFFRNYQRRFWSKKSFK